MIDGSTLKRRFRESEWKFHRTCRAALGRLLGGLVVVATLFASPADGGKPTGGSSSSGGSHTAKGEWVDCNTVSEVRQDGDNQLITVAITEKFTGTLSGSYEGIERNVVHKDGSGSFNGSGTFSGEVNGRSGTAVMTYSGTVDAKGAATAHWVLDQGTDALARLDGQGTFEGKPLKPAPAGCTDSKSPSAFSGTYTGSLRFSAN
jgi:hypothetical protein